MLGIAYAKRSLKGATRGSESGNLPRRYPAVLFRYQASTISNQQSAIRVREVDRRRSNVESQVTRTGRPINNQQSTISGPRRSTLDPRLPLRPFACTRRCGRNCCLLKAFRHPQDRARSSASALDQSRAWRPHRTDVLMLFRFHPPSSQISTPWKDQPPRGHRHRSPRLPRPWQWIRRAQSWRRDSAFEDPA